MLPAVPAGGTVTLSTCSSITSFATVLWLVATCPTSRLSNGDVVTVATPSVASCDAVAPGTGRAPLFAQVVARNLTGGLYYVMVEGQDSASGTSQHSRSTHGRLICRLWLRVVSVVSAVSAVSAMSAMSAVSVCK